MGGETRDTPPTPLLLRSGDVVVLSGAARRCYHGEGWTLGKARQRVNGISHSSRV